jgi:signal transduction histidine kinase
MEHRLLLVLFSLSPLVWAAVLLLMIRSHGTPGFRMEPTQSCFVVSRVDLAINPVREGDRIVALSGAGYHRVLGFLVSGGEASAKPHQVTILRDGEQIDLTLTVAPLGFLEVVKSLWAHLIVAGVLTLLTVLSITKAPPGQPADLLLISMTFFGLLVVTEFPMHFGTLDPGLQSLAFFSTVTANWLAFGSWTHFVLQFPAERQFLNNRPFLTAGIYLLPPVVAVGLSLAAGGFSPAFFGWLQRLRYWSLPLIILGTYWKHLLDLRKASSPLAKNQLKLVLAGGAMGISPYLFLYLLPNILINRPLIPFSLVILCGTSIPIGLFLAIVRYRLLDVDQLIGTGAAYTILVMGLVVSYSAVLAIFNRWIWRQQAFTEELTIGFTILVIVFFNPLRDRVRYAVDRAFFRDQLDFRALLDSFSRKIARSIEMRDLIETTVAELPRDFRLAGASLVILEKDQVTFHPPDMTQPGLMVPDSTLARALREGRDFFLCNEEDAQEGLVTELRALRLAGFSVALGLKSGKNLLGFLLLGEKKSGRPYSGAEIHLLATLSHHVAVALQNALRYESLQESKTRLQILFNKVVQAERLAAIGEMTAVLAHEIKNPLGVIRSSAEFLTRSARPPHVQEELLRYIVEETDRLTLVVNNILGLARYKPPELRPIDLAVHVRSLLDRWRMSADHHANVEIELESRYSGSPVYADGNQIAQVVMNLVRNAEEAMPEGGMLRVGILQDLNDSGVMLRFEDGGPGIPEEHLPNLFKKFFTTKEGGLGLGLAICEQIVASHRGTISIENNEGSGATARVRLPCHPYGRRVSNL